MRLTYMELDLRVARYQRSVSLDPCKFNGFQERVALSWLFHDFAMDGVALLPEDVDRALSFGAPRHHCDGVLLATIRRKLDAIRWVQGFAEEHEGPLDLEDLKRFHAAVCRPEDPAAGRYRKGEGPMLPYVHTISKQASISYRLRRLVETMENEYATMHPVRAAALIHHEFMATWPFDKQTGTAGRLLLNFILLRGGLPPAVIHARNRHAYFQALGSHPESMVQVVREAIDMTLDCAESLLQVRVA
jgi:hypothetical protein